MRAVVLEMPEHWIEERRKWGADRRDEVWDGVLHMVPQPTTTHMLLSSNLHEILKPLARARNLELLFETSLFGIAGEKNYRVPDLVIFDRACMSERGLEQRAEIAIEILSPNDESREKLPFYAACRIKEVWLIEPKTRAFEILSLADDYTTAGNRSAVLDIAFSVVPGPRLRLEWPGGAADI